MFFTESDAGALGRCLAQIADSPSDTIDLFLEWKRELELRSEEPGPGVVARADRGLAVRLVRDGHTFLAARDDLGKATLESALREVSRVSPAMPYRVPEWADPTIEDASKESELGQRELAEFPNRVRRLVRERLSAFEFRLRVARFDRRIQIVGRRLVPAEEREMFFSLEASTPWSRLGTLAAALDEAMASRLADCLVGRFHARASESPAGSPGPLVLGPAATAVLLHEAVAHALEADTLILSGRPEAAVGVTVGSPLLDVVDSPSDLPNGLERKTDDEGLPVLRRWLLQQGRVSQPLADRLYAGFSSHLLPGAARRGGRHLPPVPRSTHLELVAGSSSSDELLAGSGIFLPEISRGRLDPLSGELEVEFPYGRRFRSGKLLDWVGGSFLKAQATAVLSAVEAVGGDARFAGAGWCAKAGHRLPVWATCPTVRLGGLELVR